MSTQTARISAIIRRPDWGHHHVGQVVCRDDSGLELGIVTSVTIHEPMRAVHVLWQCGETVVYRGHRSFPGLPTLSGIEDGCGRLERLVAAAEVLATQGAHR